MKKIYPSQEEVRRLLNYDAISGVLTWRARGDKWDSFRDGQVAGCPNKDGYLEVGRQKWLAHKLAWIWMTGSCPKEIDHKNGRRDDNAWSNLRETSRTLNNANAKLRKDNILGFKGVHRGPSGRYRAQIKCGPTKRHLGCFDTPEEAHIAYMRAAVELFGKFARSA